MARKFLTALTIAALAGSAFASDAVINEVVTDPDGGNGGDTENEFIELFGCPEASLDGYVVLVINSDGSDEIDEAFHFPTSGGDYKFNEDGYFVILSTSGTSSDSLSDQAADSNVYEALPSSVTDGGTFTGDRHEASFAELETASEAFGKLANTGSITIVLLCDVDPADLGDLQKDDAVPTTGGVADYPGTLLDEIAWTDNGGNEWTESEANEFDYSPGFNPDYAIRVANITDDVVDTSIDIGGGEPYRDAYSEWYMGEIDSNPNPPFSNVFEASDTDGYAPEPTRSDLPTPSTRCRASTTSRYPRTREPHILWHARPAPDQVVPSRR